MDIMAIIGLIAAAGLLLYGISDGGSIDSFISSGPAAVAFGGTFAALMIAFPVKMFASLPKLLLKIFFPRIYNFDPQRFISEIEGFAAEAKKNGLLGIEEKVEGCKDGFMRKGLQLAVDSEEPKIIREIMESEFAHMAERHKSEILFFEKGAVYAPGFGFLGTLSGLVNVFAGSEDQIGMNSAIAAALIATFYGLIMSNIIFLPLSVKLRKRNEAEALCGQIAIEGAVSIAKGESPKQIREKLLERIPPLMRKPDKIKLSDKSDTKDNKRIKNK